MSDWLQDTPPMAVHWCPTCQPEKDPTKEILETRYCVQHAPTTKGADDDAVNTPQAWLNGSTEADGVDCREFQKLITRRKS